MSFAGDAFGVGNVDCFTVKCSTEGDSVGMCMYHITDLKIFVQLERRSSGFENFSPNSLGKDALHKSLRFNCEASTSCFRVEHAL